MPRISFEEPSLQYVETGWHPELDRLPPRFNRRWSAIQKAAVIDAVEADLLTYAQAAARYGLTETDVRSWKVLVVAEQRSLVIDAIQPGDLALRRVTNLIALLQARGVIDEIDRQGLDLTGAEAGRRYLDLLVDDQPISWD